MPTVATAASALAGLMLKRNYLRGRGLHFVSLGLTIRRGYRRHQGPRPVLRKARKI